MVDAAVDPVSGNVGLMIDPKPSGPTGFVRVQAAIPADPRPHHRVGPESGIGRGMVVSRGGLSVQQKPIGMDCDMRIGTSTLATLLLATSLLPAGRAQARASRKADPSGRGENGRPPLPRARDWPRRPSTPWRRMPRNPAAAAAASSGTVTSSRSGATRSGWPTSSRRPRGPSGRLSSGWPSTVASFSSTTRR